LPSLYIAHVKKVIIPVFKTLQSCAVLFYYYVFYSTMEVHEQYLSFNGHWHDQADHTKERVHA